MKQKVCTKVQIFLMKSKDLPPPINIYYIFLTRRLNTSCVITRSSRHRRKRGKPLAFPKQNRIFARQKTHNPNSL